MTGADDMMVKPGSKFRLAGRKSDNRLGYRDKASAKEVTARNAAEIDRLQDMLFAEGRRALLVVLQGTDTSGKDGTIRDVFSKTDPLGMQVTAFKVPSEEERAHDYLWRVHRAVPARGTIGIFNRAHYEDVLVVKVKELAPAADIELRYDQINAFEKMLVENGVTILKFMLHISSEEQAERLQARLDDPEKRWKFNAGDLEDRALWPKFHSAYETMLARCSTRWAPWYVVPSDKKWVRSAAISEVVRATLEKMNPRYPLPDWDPKEFKIA